MDHKFVSASQHGLLQKKSRAKYMTERLDTITMDVNAGKSVIVFCLTPGYTVTNPIQDIILPIT